jgi:uroporphyrin-III C-methyltransferase / precorrin-2 dehydrogenase / sirohydrochlorin ferrochelatase
VTGRVSLVGAGPGDADLLTVRAQRRLADADLVLFDALAGPELRALAPEARWFYVGKRAGRASMPQQTINRLLIREARRGHDVVRLKGGDPFVLGRGGEEALALVEAGIPFEIIPGVSSAVAAPALAGIPVTHRGLASAFVVLSGHAAAAYGPVIEGLQPGALTLVVLMGYGARADIAGRLRARGFAADTPAAMIAGAATPEAWRWLGRLDQLADAAVPEAHLAAGAAVTLVVGAVVALAETLAAEVAPLSQVGAR